MLHRSYSHGIIPVIVDWTQKSSGRIIVEPSPALVFSAKGRIRFWYVLHEPIDNQHFKPVGIISAASVSTSFELNSFESYCTKSKEVNSSPVVEHHRALSGGCHEWRESTVEVPCRICTDSSPLDVLSMIPTRNVIHHTRICVVDHGIRVGNMGSSVCLCQHVIDSVMERHEASNELTFIAKTSRDTTERKVRSMDTQNDWSMLYNLLWWLSILELWSCKAIRCASCCIKRAESMLWRGESFALDIIQAETRMIGWRQTTHITDTFKRFWDVLMRTD